MRKQNLKIQTEKIRSKIHKKNLYWENFMQKIIKMISIPE